MKLAIISLCCLAAAFHAVAENLTGWTLVWADEFSQTNGSSPDPAKWTYDIGASGWGNKEWQHYTSRTNNVRIEDGYLIIEARKERYQGSDYTSARLKTQGKAAWTYGRFEARIRIPRGQGIWPAFWMLGTNITSVNWPECGEIDILENIGREPTTIHGTVHGPGYSGGDGIGGPYSLPDNSDFADDFHVYAVEWTTNSIKWFLDGKQYFSINPGRLPSGSAWVFNAPQFMILNVAVGGNWPGYPDETTTFPQRMMVDYVRVYAPSNLVSCNENLLLNPGFDAGGLAAWQVYGQGFNTLLETINNVPTHNGTNVFKVFGGFNGSDNFSGVYQNIAISAEQKLAASGWAFTPLNDRIAGANAAWLEVSFRDAGANVLSLYRSALFNSSTPAGAWVKLHVTNQLNPADSSFIGTVTNLVAPANSSVARIQVVFRQPAMSAGAVMFDDLNLSVMENEFVPVPASVAWDGNHLNLGFDTFLELPYEVRWKAALTDPAWQMLTNLTGDGLANVVRVDTDSSCGFYRVHRLCN